MDTDVEGAAHPTMVAFGRPPAAEVDAGTDILLKVKVSCPYGCDLRERIVHVIAPDGAIVGESRLVEFAERVNETAEFSCKAPDEVGEYAWTVVFAQDDAEDLVHEQGTLPIVVRTMAHDTSLAVWGVPSPIVMNHPFRIQVGATCTSGCDLRGKEIEIHDDTGGAIARAALGSTPWEGTRALYWTEVGLVAPAATGPTTRSVRFTPAELRLPHGGASARFGFETVRPPQHSVTVRVVERDAGTPIEDAQVRLGVYFAYSNADGLATVAVPEGTYTLDVLKAAYEISSRELEVGGDVAVEVAVAAIPPENPDAYWLFDPSKRI